MTNYPLGSFPRFGHQERWAQERRARAITNSIITRQNKAAEQLNAEKAFFNWFTRITNSMAARNKEGKKTIARVNKKLWDIRTKLEGGKRVYFRCLGRLLHTVAVNANKWPEIHHLDDDALAAVAEKIGNEEIFKIRHPNL